MTWRYVGQTRARRCGSESAEFFADFRPDQVKEEDQVEQTLNEGGSLMLTGKYPQLVGRQKEDGCQRQRPGPAEEHELAGAGGDERCRKNGEQGRIKASADHAQNDDASQDEEIKTDGGQTGEPEQIAARRLGPVLFDIAGFIVDRHRVWR